MDPFKKKRDRPEAKIQEEVIDFLTLKSWFVKETHGNLYQQGFPDLFATHSRYGARWVEIKYAEKYSFTPGQMEWFPKFVANGSGIWILTAATEVEYQKLFQPCNWWQFLSVAGKMGSR